MIRRGPASLLRRPGPGNVPGLGRGIPHQSQYGAGRLLLQAAAAGRRGGAHAAVDARVRPRAALGAFGFGWKRRCEASRAGWTWACHEDGALGEVHGQRRGARRRCRTARSRRSWTPRSRATGALPAAGGSRSETGSCTNSGMTRPGARAIRQMQPASQEWLLERRTDTNGNEIATPIESTRAGVTSGRFGTRPTACASPIEEPPGRAQGRPRGVDSLADDSAAAGSSCIWTRESASG